MLEGRSSCISLCTTPSLSWRPRGFEVPTLSLTKGSQKDHEIATRSIDCTASDQHSRERLGHMLTSHVASHISRPRLGERQVPIVDTKGGSGFEIDRNGVVLLAGRLTAAVQGAKRLEDDSRVDEEHAAPATTWEGRELAGLTNAQRGGHVLVSSGASGSGCDPLGNFGDTSCEARDGFGHQPNGPLTYPSCCAF
mmetsp:Transcript_6222/g.12946  ORF Transcript_6222/g.12946 Transcript_6222/m.12946 type:complete len:195 (+) Transcript_6222:136-720(+)